MRRTLLILAEDKRHILSRVTNVLWRSGLSTEALTVARTHNPHLLQITVSFNYQNRQDDKLSAELSKLVNIIGVWDPTNNCAMVDRELALIKVNADESELPTIQVLLAEYDACAVDFSNETVILQIADTSERVNALIDQLDPFGLLEISRTGQVGVFRS